LRLHDTISNSGGVHAINGDLVEAISGHVPQPRTLQSPGSPYRAEAVLPNETASVRSYSVQLTPLEVSIGAAALTTVLTAVVGIVTARRAAYDRVMKTLDFVSEGPVAKARHRIGGLWCEPNKAADGWDPIEELFTILWAARRIDAVRQSLKWTSWAGGPKRLLRTSTRDWVDWWWQPIPDGTHRICAVADMIPAAQVDAVDTTPMAALYEAWCGPERSNG